MPRYFLNVDGRLIGDTYSSLRAARKAADEVRAAKPDSVVEVRGVRK